MAESGCSPLVVHQIFQSLLRDETSSQTAQKLAGSPRSPRLTAPPAKNTIRFIENDQNRQREKYDGSRWRLACTWNQNECTNIAYAHKLCTKHNRIRLNKEPTKKKRKLLATKFSLPIIPHHAQRNNDDDSDIEILEEYCKFPTTRYSLNSNMKSEMNDFHAFSVDNVDNHDFHDNFKLEPQASSSYACTTGNEIQYVSTIVRANGINVGDLVSKKIPPLTDFEEDFIASRLIQRVPTNAPMLDGQLFLHDEAITVVKKNYRIKMDSVAPEYFYDFLIRHPHVAIHYHKWFQRCKPIPPTTGCSIDTKFWSLSMMVRGSMSSDNMIDECEE